MAFMTGFGGLKVANLATLFFLVGQIGNNKVVSRHSFFSVYGVNIQS